MKLTRKRLDIFKEELYIRIKKRQEVGRDTQSVRQTAVAEGLEEALDLAKELLE